MHGSESSYIPKMLTEIPSTSSDVMFKNLHVQII